MANELKLEMAHEEGENGYVFLQPASKGFLETTDAELTVIDRAEAKLLHSNRDDIPEHPQQGEKAPFGTVEFDSDGGLIGFHPPGE